MVDILSYVIDNFQLYYEFNRSDLSYGIDCRSKVNIVCSPNPSFFSEKKDLDLNRVVWKEWKGQRIPFLFEKEDQELYSIVDGRATIHFDLIAASFYFLSGWNEYVTEERDKYGRMPYDESLIKKLGIVRIPVVNYYFDILASVLSEVSTVKKKRLWGDHAFASFLSHDIDTCRSGWRTSAKSTFLKGKLFSLLRILIMKVLGRDEYFNFNKIIDIENKFEAKSTFFFLRRIRDPQSMLNADYNLNSAKMRKVKKYIQDKGFEVGVHGSRDAHIDISKLREDLSLFSDVRISGNRFHYLMFDAIETVALLERADLEYDSSLGFAEQIGFRRATCYPYYLFNFKQMKSSKVLEIPLICMDTTLYETAYMGLQQEEVKKNTFKLIEEIIKFEGVFTLLWHNNNFSHYTQAEKLDAYQDILAYCQDKNTLFQSGETIKNRIAQDDL